MTSIYQQGEVVRTDFMSMDDSRFYQENEDYIGIDIPLKDSLYSMSFILPKTIPDPNKFIQQFQTLDELKSFYDGFYEGFTDRTRVFLRIPKFETKSKLNLTETLKSMGMVEAFQMGNADFTDFGTSWGNLFISRVLHDTYLRIDEKGVEGAAVSTVGVGVTSVPPTISFNRPFIYIIRHIETNAIIFIGNLYDPRN